MCITEISYVSIVLPKFQGITLIYITIKYSSSITSFNSIFKLDKKL